MEFDTQMERLAELARLYKSLGAEEERAGKGDPWRDEYWALVDRLIDAGLDRPLDDMHLIDSEFWTPKYAEFCDRYNEAHARGLLPRIGWLLYRLGNPIFGPPRKS
jgi:hypothetical protein